MGPPVEMNQAANQVSLGVPRVIRRAGIWAASLTLTLHQDAALLQRRNPFREGFCTKLLCVKHRYAGLCSFHLVLRHN